MNRPSRLATLVATLIFILSQGYLVYRLHQLRPNILVLQLTFDANRYWAILAAWGETGMKTYREHFTYDFIHVFIYSTFGWSVATRGALFAPDELGAVRRTAALLPLAAVFDVAENLLQLHLLAGPVGAASPAIPLSAMCSTLKWGLAAGFAGVIGWRVVCKCAQIGRVSQ